MRTPLPLPAHKVLPKELQQALIEAAKVDPGVGPGESLARARAVEEVLQRTRWKYPRLFKPEF